MNSNNVSGKYLYIDNYLTNAGVFESDILHQCSERHRFNLKRPILQPINSIMSMVDKFSYRGAIIELNGGLPGRSVLSLMRGLLLRKKSVWVYWPEEGVVESIVDCDLKRYQKIWLVNILYCLKQKYIKKKAISTSKHVQQLLNNSKPVQFENIVTSIEPSFDMGIYLRFDYWAKIIAGGSYGHTCYVAQQLHQYCNTFYAIIACQYDLLDTLGVNQRNLRGPSGRSEQHMVEASEFYFPKLYSAMQILKPSFIYERIVLGNYVGAKLSQELKIPYIVEYNGSEISMKRSFDGAPYKQEAFYLSVEQAAFNQATAISVISETVANDLINRGVSKEKILINPNGVDPNRYAPLDENKKSELKAKHGFGLEKIIVGFIGTFGGWHGIDVLAEAMPQICKSNEQIQFLLIGNGNFKHLIDSAIIKHHLQDRVVLTGIVPQDDAIELLQMCDIYLSPHSTHMKDSPFLGSPTKLFEYMSLGGGIVASNLMQIGDVLRPSLVAEDVAVMQTDEHGFKITNQRAILCEPGNVNDFINAVLLLTSNPVIRKKLGENARNAVLESYTWKHHVERLWNFIQKKHPKDYLVTEVISEEWFKDISYVYVDPNKTAESFEVNDIYKKEAQNQWDNDACGSHYVKNQKPRTLAWYMEAERYRYQEYAPWMPQLMEFQNFSGKNVLEIGSGMGTDLAQFAKYGANVTDLDLSAGHLSHAQENFKLRGLKGEFWHSDAEDMPFADNSYSLVYSNGVIHHSPNTANIVKEIWRVLKPGGKAIIMVYAQGSLHFWRNLVWHEWIKKDLSNEYSLGEIMSSTVEISETNAKPLVKVYTKQKLKELFKDFEIHSIKKRQLIKAELPRYLRFIPESLIGKLVGWNLIIKASKPLS